MNDTWIGVATGLLLSFWGGYLLTGWLLSPLQKAFVGAGFVRPNYRGESIPVGMGVALWLGMFFTGGLFLLADEVVEIPWAMVRDMVVVLVVGTSFLVVGLLDDAVGNREATGLRGHVRKLLREREVTTGLLKAVTGGFIGVVAAWLLGAEGWHFALDALVVALTANSINLLDLRPGRACKGVLLVLAVVGFFSLRGIDSPVYWLLLGATVAYLPEDLGARMMLGDAGSNLLGGGVGVLVLVSCGTTGILAWGIFLVLFHLYAEKYSLTETIERNRLLRWLDVLGRRTA
ncbi:MAG TPA: hypothetical protein VFV52_13500 [Bacilli bacterium]|nr:hypothetical protein [Bacilli bacterium]